MKRALLFSLVATGLLLALAPAAQADIVFGPTQGPGAGESKVDDFKPVVRAKCGKGKKKHRRHHKRHRG